MSPYGPDPYATEAFVVAFLLDRATHKKKIGFTPLQIIKLAYVCHGWSLAGLDRPLFNNSNKQIQAWRYGPVVVGIYQMLKDFGRSYITLDKLRQTSHSSEGRRQNTRHLIPIIEQNVDNVLTRYPELTEALDWVFNVYKGYSGAELINMTHRPGSPWDQCRGRGIENWFLTSGGKHVPDNVIRLYYKDLGRRLHE